MQRIQPGIPQFALNDIGSASSGRLTDALGEAVRDGKVEHMRELLKQGADPEQVEPGNTAISAPADELLLAARKINRLLPRGTPAGESEFEKALRGYDLPYARELLTQNMAKTSPDLPPAKAALQLWGAATNQEEEAFLDLMLVLGDDKLARYRSDAGEEQTIMNTLLTPNGLNRVLHSPLEKAAMRHSALGDYLKQFPYYSAKPERKKVTTLNGKVAFQNNPKEQIKCRHLALAWLTSKVRGAPGGKPDYVRLQNAGQIQKTIPYQTEAEYRAFLANAQEVHMVVNQAWGRFAAKQFSQIEDGMKQGGRPVKRMLVESGGHAMAVEFKVKEQAGRKSYVQNFYDPNLTNVHKRLRSDGMRCHEAHSLDQLLHRSSLYDAYYGQSETVSMAFVVPDDGDVTAAPSATAAPGQRLRSSLDDLDLDASVLHHLLRGGFDGELEQIKERLLDHIQQHPDQAVNLLAAKNAGETPGFHMALQTGHANAVNIFAGIVLQSKLTAEQQVELLAARRPDGAPGLYIALQEGHANAVQAYSHSILQSKLDDEQKIKLLAARFANRQPGFYTALRDGRTDAVRAFADSVLQSNLEVGQKIELLAAKDPNELPGLYLALVRNNADTVRVFADSVLQSNLEARQKIELLAAKEPDECPGLYNALEANKADAVRAFVESVCRSPLSDEQKVELLAAKDNEGKPGLLAAEPEGRRPNDAAAAYRETVQQELTDKQQALLQAALSGSNKRRRTMAG